MRTKKDLLRLVKPILVDEVTKLESKIGKLESKLISKTASLNLAEQKLTVGQDALNSVRQARTKLNALVYAYECQGFFARLFRMDPTTD